MNNNILPPTRTDFYIGMFLLVFVIVTGIGAKLIDIGVISW